MDSTLPTPSQALPLPIVQRHPEPSAVHSGAARGAVRARMRWMPIGAGLAALALLAVCGAWLLWGPQGGLTRAADDGAAPPTAKEVVVLGRLAPLGELRTLAAPYGAGDARVSQVLVTEGQQVRAGEAMVTFDNAPVLRAALRVAEEQLASRQAALAQVARSVSASQAESAALLARAEVATRAADAEVQRWDALVAQGFVSNAAADQRRAQRDEAAEEQRRARAQVARHAGDETAQPELKSARVAVALAQAERDRAVQELSRSVLTAPSDGTVIALHARPGERPGAAGVLSFGDTRTMTAEIELYQADLAQVRPGQPVRLRSPALPAVLTGRLERIGLRVGRQQRIDTSPAANLDARVLEATVRLDDASSAAARRLVGLEVRAHIETGAR